MVSKNSRSSPSGQNNHFFDDLRFSVSFTVRQTITSSRFSRTSQEFLNFSKISFQFWNFQIKIISSGEITLYYFQITRSVQKFLDEDKNKINIRDFRTRHVRRSWFSWRFYGFLPTPQTGSITWPSKTVPWPLRRTLQRSYAHPWHCKYLYRA